MRTAFLLIVTLALALTKATGGAAIHPTDAGRPGLLIDRAVVIADRYARDNGIEASQHYIDSVSLDTDGEGGKFWRVTWLPNRSVKGGEVYMQIYMDGSVKVSRGR
jgi:hypothetical protein